MGAEGSRARVRDVLVLVVLGAVILGGLVHYGRARAQQDRSADPSRSSTHRPQARLQSATPTASPAYAGTCWDGRPTSSLALCSMPAGARGLAWVFPSFAADQQSCRRAGPHGYPVVQSWSCDLRAHGQPVTVIYDEVPDPQQVGSWLARHVRPGGRRDVAGAHGGRSVFEYAHRGRVRITGAYARFPYTATVIAPDAETARRAWQVLVQQRPPQAIRGLRS